MNIFSHFDKPHFNLFTLHGQVLLALAIHVQMQIQKLSFLPRAVY